MEVDSKKLEYGPWTIYDDFPSSLGFGVGGTVILPTSGFYCTSCSLPGHSAQQLVVRTESQKNFGSA